MSEQDFQNPFAALFPCSDEGEAFKTGVIPPQEIVEDPSEPPKGAGGAQGDSHLVSHFFEDVFRITLSKEPCCCRNEPSSLVFLNEVHIALHCQTDLDESCIERAVFERLLLEEPAQHIVRRKNTDEEDSIAGVKRIMFYLYQSYHRLKKLTDCKTGPFETAHHVIVTQTASALCQPEMFPDSKLGEDFMKLFLFYHDQTGHCEVLQQFLLDVSGSVVNVEGAELAEVLTPAFAHLQAKLAGAGLFDRNLFLYIDTLNYFASSETLIKALLQHSLPRELRNGKAYQQSLLGLPLGVSCLPPSEVEPFEFFREPGRSSTQDHAITEERLSLPLVTIARTVHRLFDKILRKSIETREMLLHWLGNCLDANAGRAKIWNSQLPEVYASLHASDGFFVNLSAVLLLLCKPFAEPRSPKLFKVDPLYSAAPLSTPDKRNGVHIK
ncbi:ubiquitin conjugation factor E4 A-like, partial [Uloborus diversus]|uniref:ubiquitin conjugation factor E4 A-like n=1 Tax=Uloborus diversus TaxID=327109 RepID=UPI002409845C